MDFILFLIKLSFEISVHTLRTNTNEPFVSISQYDGQFAGHVFLNKLM